MKKVSDWLSTIDGHSALSVELSRPAFEKATGKKWPKYLTGRPVKQVLKEGRQDFKGLQYWAGDPKHHVIGGWQVAAALASEYAKGFSSNCLGRGFAFRECVEAIKEAETNG